MKLLLGVLIVLVASTIQVNAQPDEGEYCTGVSMECPPPERNVVCRDPNAACPPDEVRTHSIACDLAAHCDLKENLSAQDKKVCDDVKSECPLPEKKKEEEEKKPKSNVCRPEHGPCDLPESNLETPPEVPLIEYTRSTLTKVGDAWVQACYHDVHPLIKLPLSVLEYASEFSLEKNVNNPFYTLCIKYVPGDLHSVQVASIVENIEAVIKQKQQPSPPKSTRSGWLITIVGVWIFFYPARFIAEFIVSKCRPYIHSAVSVVVGAVTTTETPPTEEKEENTVKKKSEKSIKDESPENEKADIKQKVSKCKKRRIRHKD